MSVHSRGNACDGKVPHVARAGAQIHADHLNALYGKPEQFGPYDCRFCGFIHVGRIGGAKPFFRNAAKQPEGSEKP